MSESSDVQKSVERMQIHMELRGLRPNTTYTFANCARRFLAYGSDRAFPRLLGRAERDRRTDVRATKSGPSGGYRRAQSDR